MGFDNEAVLLGGESTGRDMTFGLSILDSVCGEDAVGATVCGAIVVVDTTIVDEEARGLFNPR